jgi:hypothetical protein
MSICDFKKMFPGGFAFWTPREGSVGTVEEGALFKIWENFLISENSF